MSLGNPNFSSGDVTEGKIEFTNSNVPVVSYSSINGIYVKYFGDENTLLSITQQQNIAVNTIVISPNPITSSFSVKSDDKIETIDIFDLTGKKVFSSSETEELNISSLKSGLYLIKMKTSTGIYSEKIFKN
jgi:Secretion system C-terminal sorting domain